jgi:transposase
MDARQSKAFHIAATTALAAVKGIWKVPSQSGDGEYDVDVQRDGSWRCTCPDHETRLVECKHILAVEVTIQRETGESAETYTEQVKVTYSQNWTAYNRAQTNEKAMVMRLLADACKSIPARPQGVGRPRMSLGDMAFATVFRAYVGTSSRRFMTDLEEAQRTRLIGDLPGFNTVTRYTRDPEMTPVLASLIELTSRPLAAIETDFAVDATGFGTPNTRTWFSQKHGREITGRAWRKAHAMCGTSTHVVTAVEVTSDRVHDSVMLPQLVTATCKHFDMDRVSADKGYLSRANVAEIESHGAQPLIPFKVNSVEPSDSSPWSRMYHLYAYRRAEFLEHYHRRSNVETVFHMVKAKFGDSLFGKSPEAQDNEILAKFVAHNLCVLVQSFYELGIEPDLVRAA